MTAQHLPGERARCERHGLHYDPSKYSGCVLCRKEDGDDHKTTTPRHGQPLLRGVRPDAKAAPASRLTARFLDGMLYVLVTLLGATPGFVAAAVQTSGDTGDSVVLLVLLLILAGSVGLTAYQWYLIATTGQTLGKRWVKIRIVRQDGTPVGFVHGVVLRNWVMFALAQVVPFIGLVDALLIFGADRRCLHDLLATTDVVNVGAELSLEEDLVAVFR